MGPTWSQYHITDSRDGERASAHTIKLSSLMYCFAIAFPCATCPHHSKASITKGTSNTPNINLYPRQEQCVAWHRFGPYLRLAADKCTSGAARGLAGRLVSSRSLHGTRDDDELVACRPVQCERVHDLPHNFSENELDNPVSSLHLEVVSFCQFTAC